MPDKYIHSFKYILDYGAMNIFEYYSSTKNTYVMPCFKDYGSMVKKKLE